MMNHIGQPGGQAPRLGNYRLTRLLGQGGFAEVYLGEHTLLGTTVAIKILHTQVTPDDIVEFQQEARLLASLRHPHIVSVIDFGIDGQTPYLVMDYAPNGTLRTRHPKGTVLPVSTVVGYVKQVAEALQCAHDRKVIHRDIKPQNMLIGGCGEILLSDFGIALISQSSRDQSTKDMVGTIAYMAPEQIKRYPRSASDQYALGIVTYEWLCGTRPFHGSPTEIAIKHDMTLPSSLREHVPTISPDVEHVVLRSLAKQPEERFPSVSAFATALEQASQDLLPTDQFRPAGTSFPLSSLATLPQPTEPLVTSATRLNSSVPMPALQSSALPNPSAPEKQAGKPTVSRRIVLIGGAAGVAAITGVGIGVFAITHQLPSTPQQPSVVTPQYPHFTYTGHSSNVRGVVWSPLDGKRIASGSFDKTVQVWNANDGGNVVRYRGHLDSVVGVAWSLDGKWIASCSTDKTVQVWNVSNGSPVFTYKGHANWVYRVTWSPDGKRIASSSADKTVQVWNAIDGKNIFTYKGHSDVVGPVRWSPDGRRIASGSADGTVQVWNAIDGKNVFTYKGHADEVWTLAWSPDGERIASGSDDRTVQVWNAIDGKNVFTYKGHADKLRSIAWSLPDGKRIASSSLDKTVQVWNASDGGNVFTYKEHTNAVWSVAWSPDGKQIASGSDDATAHVWNVG